MTKLARLIAHCEGFGIPNSIPSMRHNPGDLRHSPHSWHPPDDPNGIGYIDSDELGWSDLERQLNLYASRGMTLRQLVYVYAPPADNNPTEAYLKAVCDGLGLPPETLVSEALEVVP